MTAVLVAVAGMAFIAVAAIVVGIMDSMQAGTWRRIAAERRQNWEARHAPRHAPIRSGRWPD